MTDLEVAIGAAGAGAELVAAAFGKGVAAEYKGQGNPVTNVDRAAERAIVDVLHDQRQGDAVLAEETGGSGWERGRVWVVDPLDGTVNFVHGIPQIAVSVCLYVSGRPSVGVVIDVIRHEEFSAAAGIGATLNGQPIRVSSQADFAKSLLATGFPYDRHLHAAAYASTIGVVLAGAQDVRRMGSAALDLAWVAAGRFDGYWEFGLAPWDAAAGALIVAEAGGFVTDHLGADYRLDAPAIVASNGLIHQELTQAVRS